LAIGGRWTGGGGVELVCDGSLGDVELLLVVGVGVVGSTVG
jgi:hypothetical protein